MTKHTKYFFVSSVFEEKQFFSGEAKVFWASLYRLCVCVCKLIHYHITTIDRLSKNREEEEEEENEQH